MRPRFHRAWPLSEWHKHHILEALSHLTGNVRSLKCHKKQPSFELLSRITSQNLCCREKRYKLINFAEPCSLAVFFPCHSALERLVKLLCHDDWGGIKMKAEKVKQGSLKVQLARPTCCRWYERSTMPNWRGLRWQNFSEEHEGEDEKARVSRSRRGSTSYDKHWGFK